MSRLVVIAARVAAITVVVLLAVAIAERPAARRLILRSGRLLIQLLGYVGRALAAYSPMYVMTTSNRHNDGDPDA